MTLREMTRADVGAGVRLCRLSHWNQVARDWEQFLSLAPGGATVAVDDSGEVIGSVATMRYLALSAEFGSQNGVRDVHRHPLRGLPPVPLPGDPAPATLAWLAMVLVDPAHRGVGIGMRLLERGLAQAADVTAVGLDATPLGQPLYEKLGFRAASTFTRMESDTAQLQGGTRARWPQVRRATLADGQDIVRLDGGVTGLDRRAMLEWLHVGAPECSWVYEGADGIEGVLLGRHGHHAVHVGPVVAASVAVADALLSAARADPDRPVFIDIADDRPGWRARVEALGFRQQRPFTRMYRGPWRPDGDASRLFAIIGPEFG